MGVPAFFKWLSTRNPKIIRDVFEPSPEAMSSPNPSIDNFYIDMNGLIHPSCNPKQQNIKQPTNFQQQCSNIYDYIDKLINIVRPRKLVYLAIDGVAPRAKMNQQRSRRFRAGLESKQNGAKKLDLLEKYKEAGAWNQEVEQYATKKSFDSNMITPGTEFLSSVCQNLRQYIKNRLENHLLWKDLVVIFSDSNCPGEGEHKIMDFIRQQRSSTNYSPNQSHCIYGADADLIMLALATHEPRFFIIREIVITANDKWCTNCHKRGHYFMDCRLQIPAQPVASQNPFPAINVSFQFIQIKMVREFIHYNYMNTNVKTGYNLERVIDDFVFLCFFVGNDFLPHIPCLDIREGGIDVLMKVYEGCLRIMPDYLVHQGDVNLLSLKMFIDEMCNYEDALVNEMIYRETGAKIREQNNRRDEEKKKKEDEEIDYRDPLGSFKRDLQKIAKGEVNNLQNYSVFGHATYGYKQKYYKEKFRIKSAQFLDLKNNLSRCYVEALKWICGYYYRGVQSWSWYYPFHYSPFLSDVIVPDIVEPFYKGVPFRPFEQLMAVLPPKTISALPKVLHKIMLDTNSPIIDYFPSEFVIDLVGKRFAWLGEVLLPFIDDERLLKAMGSYEEDLSQQETFRNRYGVTNIYLNCYGRLGRKMSSLELGKSLKVKYQEGHQIEGELILLQKSGQASEYCFIQPENREHSVLLKQGIYYQPLEELDDQFMSKTDRNAFGGQRYLKVVDRVMAKRKHGPHQHHEDTKNDREDENIQNRNNKYNSRGRRDERDRDRERSREKKRQNRDNQRKQRKDYRR